MNGKQIVLSDAKSGKQGGLVPDDKVGRKTPSK